MAKLVRRVVGAILLISAVIVTQIPMPDVFAANGVEDFQRDEDKLVKYTGTATDFTFIEGSKKAVWFYNSKANISSSAPSTAACVIL